MYNLTAIVNFPTRISNKSASTIDNFFMDISRLEDFSVTPFPNDLSDHDAQILAFKIPIQIQHDKTKLIRKIDKHSISDFIYILSNETWDSVFDSTDVNLMFNSFLNTYLRIFYSCFPLKKTRSSKHNNNWITLGNFTQIKLCMFRHEINKTAYLPADAESNILWGHPHVIPFPIQSRFTSQLSFLYKNGHAYSLRTVNAWVEKKQHHERTHQDRRYDTRLLGHVASHHLSPGLLQQHSTQSQPPSTPPRTSGKLTAWPMVQHRPRPTGGLITTWQRSSAPRSTLLNSRR